MVGAVSCRGCRGLALSSGCCRERSSDCVVSADAAADQILSLPGIDSVNFKQYQTEVKRKEEKRSQKNQKKKDQQKEESKTTV